MEPGDPEITLAAMVALTKDGGVDFATFALLFELTGASAVAFFRFRPRPVGALDVAEVEVSLLSALF